MLAVGKRQSLKAGVLGSLGPLSPKLVGLDGLGLARSAGQHGGAFQAVEGAGIRLGAVMVINPIGHRRGQRGLHLAVALGEELQQPFGYTVNVGMALAERAPGHAETGR